MFRIKNRNCRESNGRRNFPKLACSDLAQFVCSQCNLSNPSQYLAQVLIALLFVSNALAQQSTQFDEFELHHSIVYSTFLSPKVAAEYGIVRGADKAILTLSVRNANSGEIAGRPMNIEGRTWDLITGGEMDIQEIKEGKATYYIIPFEFLDREYRFFEFAFQPDGSERQYSHKMKVQLWRQD